MKTNRLTRSYARPPATGACSPFGNPRGLKPAARSGPSDKSRRKTAYVLLETVIATGLLILGMAVLGAQIQDADKSVRRMDLRIRAMALAEMQLAHLDTGLIEIDSMDEVEEEEFGPRYPDWGWRLTTEETITDDLFRLKLEILYKPRDDPNDEFDFDAAENLFTFYAFRARPKPLNFAEDFGLREEEMEEMAEKLSMVGVDGLDPENFDPALLAKLESEELMEVLPTIMEAFGMDVDAFLGALPPEVQAALREGGMLEELGGEEDAGKQGDGFDEGF